MSEYWVSKKKYFCKYCDIYIADDAPSRQQHENGLRHQGNKNRFVRELYKNGERKKRDLEEEKREMKRVDARCRSSRVCQGCWTCSSLIDPPRAPVPGPSRPSKPANPYTNYSDAASLGYTDVDGDFLAAQKAIRQKEGRMGEWTYVAPPVPAAEDSVPGTTVDEQATETKEWRLDGPKQRQIAIGLGDIYDPGIIKVKKREDETKDEGQPEPPAPPPPTWTPRGWKRAGEEGPDPGSQPPQESPSLSGTEVGEDIPTQLKAEEASAVAIEEKPPVVKTEPLETASNDAPVSSSGLFRKRKAPTTSASTRGVRRKI
ncbi:hypothetical protein BS47DRAFT_1370837 [Hydnum rufescens UP504]|uniref:Matrin-type domain-containing protein n=1 Tax=Hydnum rufescens UP504 TaxID=1448309 RepID=A0A9P6DY90_9AGAM|nr:hypothetical protein BS47DRAFT_1370837 [Hydnum rufescens UP504]